MKPYFFKKRIASAVALMIFTATGLCSCSDVEEHLVIRPDGSGTLSIKVRSDTALAEMGAAFGMGRGLPETRQINLEVTGTGNPYELEFKMEQLGKSLKIYTYDDAENGKSSNSRTLQLNYYSHRFSQKKLEGQPDLIIRRPSDMKREMVRFELSEIDLY